MSTSVALVPGASTSSTAVAAESTSSTASQFASFGGSGLPYGFDPRPPFDDHDATAKLGNPAFKIVTAYVAVGNRLASPLPLSLSDVELVEGHDLQGPASGPSYQEAFYSDTVPPIWKPALEAGDIPANTVVGGYISWRVPWYAWPIGVAYKYKVDYGNRPSNNLVPVATWGHEKARFRGADTVTRLDAAIAVSRVAQEKLAAPPATYLLPFTDVPETARADLALLAYNGVIGGTSATEFSSSAVCSRGQAAKMFSAMLVKTTTAP